MSKVVLIGDRAVGKTSTVHALCTPPYEKVKPQDGPSGDVAQTESIEIKNLTIIVELPWENFDLSLVWIDTPGELQSNRQKQEDNPEIWGKFSQEVQTSDYVMLLLPPHQGLCNNKNISDIDSWPTTLQSETRFKEWWIPFLSQNCRQPSNILICRHQADLLIPDIIQIGNKYKYRYANEGFSWKKYFDFTDSYFPEVDSEISAYRRNHRRQEVRLFVTTIKNRSLLELPWISIATRESSKPKY